MKNFNESFLTAKKTVTQLIVLKRDKKRVSRVPISRSFVLVLLLLSMFVYKTANSQEFECFVISPPEKVLPGVKKIAILNFENFDKNAWYDTYGGSAFVDYLTAKLLDDSRGLYALSGGMFSSSKEGKTFIKSTGINVFQIVEREQLNKILNEKNLGGNVTLNDNQAAEIGKVLGIDVLILGTIKHTYNSNRTVSTYNDGSKVYFTENTCETEILIKVVSVENAQILATKPIKRVSKDKKGGADEGKVLGFSQLAESNMKALAFDASCLIAPYYIYYKADFQKIKVAEFKEKAANTKTYLENEDFKSVYSLNKAIYDADNYNAESACNLARLYFIVGDYQEAANWTEIAYTIDSKTYGKTNEMYKTWAKNASLLKSMGIEIEKYDFSSANSGDALADKVTTKGKKADRYEVYSEPSNNSTVVTKVPGDSEFVVIENKGDFVLIKLLGGKQGYIPKASIK